ncbi:MAG TPA: glycosyltransferase family 4 protein [Thermoanaerobaculia bacterium]|nr:glycosyltransferase family 4 protein [Thermoanaerobaculia bacterium]
MRVAYVSADPGVPVFGSKGNSVHVQEMIRAFLKSGAEVHLFTPNSGGEPPHDLRTIAVHRLPRAPKGDLAERERSLISLNDVIAGVIAAHGPFDLLYERYSLWNFAAIEYARRHGIPAVLEVNAPLIDEQADHRGLADRDAATTVARRAFRAANVLVAVSDGVAGYLRQFPDVGGTIEVVPNGVNPERFSSHESLELGDFVVGFLGTLKPWHGLETLIAAFARVHAIEPRARLLVVGDGPERERIERDLASRGLSEASQFAGAVRPDEVPRHLMSMSVGTAPYIPSDRFYFSPLKVLEYMAAQLPVVASRIGQIEQLIEHGRTGLLCKPGDPESLASTLLTLSGDVELRRRLGAAARRHVFAHHTWDAAAARILRVAMENYATP